jgi:HlyD family secretion protein
LRWPPAAGTGPPAASALILHPVRYENLQLTIVERGALESANNSDIYCRVKARLGSTFATTIKWIIDDGTYVRQGQLIVDLDDAAMQDELKRQKIVLDQAQAAKVFAEENYKIVESQNESAIKTAETNIKVYQLDLTKYLEGIYPQMLKDIQGRIETSESDLELWRDRAAWSERMVKKGYLSPSQAVAERSKLRFAEIGLAKVNEELRVLDLTRDREVTFYTGMLQEARRALDRALKSALATEAQAASDRESKRSIYEQERARYLEIEEEIRKCDIFSPQDGMVVYHIPEQSFFGTGSQQSIIAQGEPVREGQKLMRIPDLRNMVVQTKVHEALVSRVRGERYQSTGFCDSVQTGLSAQIDPFARLISMQAFAEMRDSFRDREQVLIYGGQAARIRVDAYPGRTIRGHVRRIADAASQADRYSSDVKVYQTVVALDEEVPGLKPGMSAEVTIQIEDVLENVLTVPVHAIVGSTEMGEYRKVFVMTPTGPQERQIVVGLSNERMAEVRAGLQEGEQVVLNPRVLLGDNAKVRQVAPDGGKASPGGRRSDGKAGKREPARDNGDN